METTPVAGKSDHTKKRAWTEDEDQRLISYIQSHGTGCWPSVPKATGLLRSGKSCRLRWINYLNPDLKRGNFTDEEEELIIKLHSLLNNKWSLIASRLPGRTDNEVRNYWNSHISKKLKERGIDSLTHRPMRTISLFPSESSIGEEEEETRMNTPDVSTSNVEEELSDGSDIACRKSSPDSTELLLDQVLFDPEMFCFDSMFQVTELLNMIDSTTATNGTTEIPPPHMSSPIPEDLQNEKNVVLQLDSYGDATQNERNVADVEESNTNDTGVDRSKSTTCITSSLDKTSVSKTPDKDYVTTKIRTSLEVLKQHFCMNMGDAAKKLHVSRSSLKRICRENGIERWPFRKRKNINRRQLSNIKKVNKLVRDNDEQITESTRRESSPPEEVAIVTPLGDASSSSSVTIKATCGDDIVKFQLSLSSGIDDLREKVAKRLVLEVGSFKLKHKDDAGDLVLIACDEALQDCLDRFSRSVDKSTLDMLVFPVINQSVLHSPLFV